MPVRRALWILILLPWSLAAAQVSTLVDSRGMPLQLGEPVTRVVALAPFLTEIVFALGAGHALVGVSEFSDYPQAARYLPRVANAFSADYETIMGLAPQLVLAWESGTNRRVLQGFEKLNVPVFTLEPRRIREVAAAFVVVGRLLGREDRGRVLARQLEQEIAGLRTRFENQRRVSVFYQISERPLMTLNGKHLVTELIDICGGTNIFGSLAPLAPTVSVEAVVRGDPELIVISSTIHDVAQIRQRWFELDNLRATRAGHVYTVDSSLLNRQTPRLIEGARQLCRVLDRAR